MTTQAMNSAYHWVWGGASQQGGRHEQQDRWAVFETPTQDHLFAILADGMGGHIGGALGAQAVIDCAQTFFQHPPVMLATDPATALCQLCRTVHEGIGTACETARSTVIMVWIDGNATCWLNIGDSRLYHFRDGQRLMRTRDHSAVQLLMDMGEISEAEMATHPAQNRLYRSLGGHEIAKPDHGTLTVCAGDLLVLCSDGIWEHVTEADMWTAGTTQSPTDAAEWLAEQAIQHGGPKCDNATLIVLRAASTSPVVQPAVRWHARLSAQFAAFFGQGKPHG